MTAQPSTPPARGLRVWIVVALILGAVAAVAITVWVVSREDDATPVVPPTTAEPTPDDLVTDPAADPTADAPETADAPPEASGAREDPFAAGEPVVAGGWTTTVGPTDVDAWAALSTDLNDVELVELAPPAGTSYVVAPLTVTYADGTPTDLGSFEVSFVGASGTSYPVIGSTCRLALDDLFPTSDVYEEPEVTGRVCTDVPTSDAPGGTWRVALNIYDDASSSASKDYEGYVAVD